MNICILGAGALGCAIGGALAEAGADVTLVNRSPAHVAAINAHGLTLVTPDGERVVAVRAATSCAGLGEADVVVVLVKSFDTRSAMEGARSIVGPDTVVLSLQNGLGHEVILAEIVGPERVMAGKTYVGGVMLGPGRILSGVTGKRTVIGELDGTVTPRVQRIADVFNRAGLRTEVSDNILGTAWDKLLINVATGALSGITGLVYGELYAIPAVRDTALAAVAEAMAVARAGGVRLSMHEPVEAWDRAAAGLPFAFKTSMLQSLEKGSITEIDFINGAVVRAGARVGVPTPVNAALVASIKGIERRMAIDRQSTQPAQPKE